MNRLQLTILLSNYPDLRGAVIKALRRYFKCLIEVFQDLYNFS